MRVNNYTTLAWHSTLGEQAHRRSFAFGHIHPIVCGVNTLPPFQLVREHTGEVSWFLELIGLDGTTRDISQDMAAAGAYFNIGTTYDVLVYNGGILSEGVAEGSYYLRATDNSGKEWFSDIFATTTDIDNYMIIEWWDSEDFEFDGGRIVYDGYVNKLYVKSDIGKPEYTFEEEGEERDGLFFPSSQLSTKTYNFSFVANEAVCDALRFARLSEYVYVTDAFGNRYRADSFLMTTEWGEQGDLAQVTVEFTSQSVAKKLGLGYFRT